MKNLFQQLVRKFGIEAVLSVVFTFVMGLGLFFIFDWQTALLCLVVGPITIGLFVYFVFCTNAKSTQPTSEEQKIQLTYFYLVLGAAGSLAFSFYFPEGSYGYQLFSAVGFIILVIMLGIMVANFFFKRKK